MSVVHFYVPLLTTLSRTVQLALAAQLRSEVTELLETAIVLALDAQTHEMLVAGAFPKER